MEGTGYRDSRNASSSDDRFWDNDRTSERTPLRPGRDDRQALPSQKHHPQQYPPPYSAVLAEDAQLTSLPSQQSRAPRTNLIGWLVWIAAFVGATITAICIPRPGSHDVLLVAGSRKLVELPTKWFREVEIAGSSHVDTYLFDEEPPLTDVIQLSKKIDIDINRGSYHFVRYDLHPDSNVEVKWSFQKFDHIPTFGVIKGESRFAEWVAGNDVPLFYDRTAASGTFTLRILKTSAYYFMFFAQQSWDNASGWATLNVNATTYTLEGSIDSCPIGEQLSCSLDLAAGKHAYLLLVPPMDGDSYNLTYRTLGRSEVYTNLWLSVGAVALFCGVLTALLSWVPLKGVLRKCRGYEPIAADAEPPADGSLASPRSENVPLGTSPLPGP
ncbi:uncharacterized protein EV422DRAFT_523314 [Fimicolochytrium jonesii]|uniref:uncharacterized protein n=1 Tax=Fimicolochytrium jonesii TaxID=1396493 RepID=UPI0022FE2AF2|nr:uncharacterized protein EV422DRAFT_523314 [Fimicolochytrium jonesii]KAI8823089.1 hypothetical protein EV422DRAFT_523314 [Fimicolochytrium jonesii]